MLGYARQTGGHLVAEGVETEAELETLLALGVELVQGFYLARPAGRGPRSMRWFPAPPPRAPAYKACSPTGCPLLAAERTLPARSCEVPRREVCRCALSG